MLHNSDGWNCNFYFYLISAKKIIFNFIFYRLNMRNCNNVVLVNVDIIIRFDERSSHRTTHYANTMKTMEINLLFFHIQKIPRFYIRRWSGPYEQLPEHFFHFEWFSLKILLQKVFMDFLLSGKNVFHICPPHEQCHFSEKNRLQIKPSFDII